ncbi:MAG: PorT family protein [Lentimicrobium sp.]|nr:PorT family protein [Lentimicrobium sp.]
MKRLIFLMLIFITASLVQAQIPSLTFGPKAGASFSNFSSDNVMIEEQIKGSLNFGIFVRLGNKIYLQPEISFMNRKGELYNNDIPESNKTIHVKTLDIPLLLGIEVMDARLFNVRVMGGPVASLAVNKDVNSQNWLSAITEEEINGANWGIQVGAGIDFLIFTFDLRYEIGMSDFSKNNDLTLKNNLLVAGLGIKLL